MQKQLYLVAVIPLALGVLLEFFNKELLLIRTPELFSFVRVVLYFSALLLVLTAYLSDKKVVRATVSAKRKK